MSIESAATESRGGAGVATKGTFAPKSEGSRLSAGERAVRSRRDGESAKGAKIKKRRSGLMGRIEAFISRLSTRNNFWHRVCSLIYLPYAYRSGIRMKRVDKSTFTAVLPFRRFNKNWYNAMAGAALLANSEIAGGMYLFAAVGAEYTVVCKELNYKFLRPCLGPAIYRVVPPEGLDEMIATHEAFNIEVVLHVLQQRIPIPGAKGKPDKAGPEAPKEKELRVGRCRAVFHVTPKSHHEAKEKRQRELAAKAAREAGSAG